MRISQPSVFDAISKQVIPETWYEKIYLLTKITKENLFKNAKERIVHDLKERLDNLQKCGYLQHDGNIVPSRRLAFLKGELSIKKFAKKCKVDEKSMAKYLETGKITLFGDLFQICKATGVSLSWLNGGEPWLNPFKKYSGLSFDSHKKIARALRRYKKGLQNINEIILDRYPLSGPDFDKYESIQYVIESIEHTCELLSDALKEEHQDEYPNNIYEITTIDKIPERLKQEK